MLFCRPPYSSCRTPQTKRELLGVRYAVQGVDGNCQEDDLAPEVMASLPPAQAQAVNVIEAEALVR